MKEKQEKRWETINCERGRRDGAKPDSSGGIGEGTEGLQGGAETTD